MPNTLDFVKIFLIYSLLSFFIQCCVELMTPSGEPIRTPKCVPLLAMKDSLWA